MGGAELFALPWPCELAFPCTIRGSALLNTLNTVNLTLGGKRGKWGKPSEQKLKMLC